MPRYPQIHIHLQSRNPFALVSAVRLALRRSRVPGREIHRFTSEALLDDEPSRIRRVCAAWAVVD
jgi:hypothetical protein